MHISDLLSISDFRELVNNMNKNIQEALDIQAPIKKKQLSIRIRVPWYTVDHDILIEVLNMTFNIHGKWTWLVQIIFISQVL